MLAGLQNSINVYNDEASMLLEDLCFDKTMLPPQPPSADSLNTAFEVSNISESIKIPAHESKYKEKEFKLDHTIMKHMDNSIELNVSQ